MAVAIRGSRDGVGSFGSNGLRSFFSYRIFVSAMFFLLFLATLSVLLTSNPSTSLDESALPVSGKAYMRRSFLALKSNPLKTRLGLIYRQENDHITLANAYVAYARKLKIDSLRQLRLFDDLARNFSDVQMKPSYK